VRAETVNGDARETLPAMTRDAKACEGPRLIVPEVTVRVTVDDPALSPEDGPDVSQEPDAEMEPLVSEIEFVAASFIVTLATMTADVVPIRLPPPEIVRLAPPVMLFPDVVSVPTMDKVPLTSIALLCVTAPEIVRLLKPLDASSVATVFAVPDMVTVLVPFVNTEPAPLVSQLPVLVNELVVSVIVPLVPPVIVTLETVIAEAFAVRMPPFPTFSAPPVKPRLAVARAVVEDPSDTLRFPPQIMALVAIVNVWADAADEVNVMLLNSLPGRFVPANVMVPPVGLVNVAVPVPGLQEADVEAFVQVPVTVQVDEPMTM